MGLINLWHFEPVTERGQVRVPGGWPKLKLCPIEISPVNYVYALWSLRVYYMLIGFCFVTDPKRKPPTNQLKLKTVVTYRLQDQPPVAMDPPLRQTALLEIRMSNPAESTPDEIIMLVNDCAIQMCIPAFHFMLCSTAQLKLGSP